MKENYKNLPWHSRKVIDHAWPLTDIEKLELAKEMVEAQTELTRLESKLAHIREIFKTRKEIYAGIFNKAANQFKKGLADPVKIECDVYQDFENEEMVFVPVDSALEIKRRPMLDNEKKPNLFSVIRETNSKIKKFKQED